ncbi:exodeoxyribonuclease VII large subunit [bacterium]|nr:MAG: exodeoxyribonuclease VII large subunit [bacterium]
MVRSVRVQGEGASKEIAEGIEDLNKFGQVDLIIVCRGGGSVEDLWAFNEEVVARAVYASKIPTISAVGHQINITLSDLASDLFVETPSAAAKIIVDKKNALLREIDGYKYGMNSSLFELIHLFKQNLVALTHTLKSPLDRLLEKEQLLDELTGAMHSHADHYIKLAGERFKALIQRLDALSPLAVLSRGYSLSMSADGVIIKDAAKLKPQDRVKTILNKGAFISLVQEVIHEREAGI